MRWFERIACFAGGALACVLVSMVELLAVSHAR